MPHHIRRRSIVREALRDLAVARRMKLVHDGVGSPNDVRGELLWRIAMMGDTDLDSPTRLSVFRDVVAAFTPFEMTFEPDYSQCWLRGDILRVVGKLCKGTDEVAILARRISPSGRVAYNEFLKASDDYRGTAIAPLILRQSFAYFDRIGVDKVVVHAALETGVYYWASCGFDFIRASDREGVRLHFQALLTLLRRSEDVSLLDSAYQFANVGKATDEMVTFEKMFQALQGAGLASDETPFRERATQNNIDWVQPVPLAKGIFLLYSHWWGELLLDASTGLRGPSSKPGLRRASAVKRGSANLQN